MFNYDIFDKNFDDVHGCYGKTIVELEPTANFPQIK